MDSASVTGFVRTWFFVLAAVLGFLAPAARGQPQAPTALTASDAGQGRVRLTWTDTNAGTATHQVERIPAFPAPVEVAAGTNFLVNDSGNGTFEYRIRAARGGQFSGWTSWSNVTVTSGTAGTTGGAPSSEGWTPLTQSADSRVIYVSTTDGIDTNNGLSPDAPVRSIAVGYARLRHNCPDWLLLKRGDVFDEPLGFMKKSGRSPLEPIVIGTYGTHPSRPLLRTGTTNGVDRSPGGGTPASVDNVAIVGLHFFAHDRTPASAGVGVRWIGASKDILFEDCMFEAYGGGMVFDGYDARIRNVKLRRNIVVDSYYTSFHSSGLYTSRVDGLRLEENLFDHNGWKAGVATPTIFNHNIYVDINGSGVVMQGNIVADASSHGAQLRPGGVANDNLFLRNPINLLMGHGGLAAGADEDPAQPATIDCRRNVFLEARDITTDLPRGWGVHVQWTTGGTIEDNVFAYQNGNFPFLIQLDGTRGAGVFNIAIRNNVSYGWDSAVQFLGDSSKVSGITFTGNVVQHPNQTTEFLMEHQPTSPRGTYTMSNNRFFRGGSTSNWMSPGGNVNSYRSLFGDTTSTGNRVTFVDATRTIATYSASIGGAGTYDDFIAQCRRQSRFNWRPEYTAAAANAYIRAGFTPLP